MDQTADRRESFRLPFISKVTCHVNGVDKTYSGILRDMSITSLFMETEDCPDFGSSCNIEIIFKGEHSRLKIEDVKGSIVRCDDDGVAVRFEKRLEWFALVPLYFNKLHE